MFAKAFVSGISLVTHISVMSGFACIVHILHKWDLSVNSKLKNSTRNTSTRLEQMMTYLMGPRFTEVGSHTPRYKQRGDFQL